MVVSVLPIAKELAEVVQKVAQSSIAFWRCASVRYEVIPYRAGLSRVSVVHPVPQAVGELWACVRFGGLRGCRVGSHRVLSGITLGTLRIASRPAGWKVEVETRQDERAGTRWSDILRLGGRKRSRRKVNREGWSCALTGSVGACLEDKGVRRGPGWSIAEARLQSFTISLGCSMR